jgi:hypothetical protein
MAFREKLAFLAALSAEPYGSVDSWRLATSNSPMAS